MCDNVKKIQGQPDLLVEVKPKKLCEKIGYWNRWIVSDNIRSRLKMKKILIIFEKFW